MGTQTPEFGLYKPNAGEGSIENPVSDELNNNWDIIDRNLGTGGGSGVEKLFIQPTAPSNPSDGDIWIDNSG